MSISFTTTAMMRSELLYRTYESFNKYLKNIDLKKHELYLNIDPAPSVGGSSLSESVKIAESFFGKVYVRHPQECNFSTAVKWLMASAESDYVFHLEDDWELIFPVNIKDLTQIFANKPEISQIRLRKPAKEGSLRKYGLSPCLIRKKFYKKMAKRLDETQNPERQLYHPDYGNERGKGKKVVVWPGFIVVVDIGQAWRDQRKIMKEDNFLKWR